MKTEQKMYFNLFFSLLLLNVDEILTTRNCCESGENVVTQRKCLDGTNTTINHCKVRYILPYNEVGGENVYIDKNENLMDYEEQIPSDQFCYARTNNTKEVYIVCLKNSDDTFHDTKIQITGAFGFISVIFLCLTIIVYLIVPTILDLQGICILQSITGLAIAYFTLGIIQFNYISSNTTCHFLAFLTYTAFIYSFFWLDILSFHLWRTIVNPTLLRFTNRWALIYHIFGVGGTFLCLVVLLTSHYSSWTMFEDVKPGIAEISCWFKSLRETFIYFYGPIGVLLAVNLVLYVWTVIVLWQQMKNCDVKKNKVLKYKLLLCIKLFFIMGITWIFELLSAALEDYLGVNYRIIWIITDTLNGLQGVLIFLILVVFRKKVIRGLANRRIFNTRFPLRWYTLKDDECEDETQEEMKLSTVAHQPMTVVNRPKEILMTE